MSASPELLAARALLSSTDDRLLVELGAWLLGRAGEPLPDLTNPVDAVHARLASAIGTADVIAVTSLLEEHLPQPDGEDLLASACELAGLCFADRLVETAHRHPDRRFVGRMLASTTAPQRLLALLPQGVPGAATIETVGELVIAGRDRGRPIAAAEARWAQIVDEDPLHLSSYRDVLLRITARESLESAVALLVELGEEWGRDRLLADAVLARLVRVAPERAVELVEAASAPQDRVAWLGGLAWWLELGPATRIASELLDHGDPELDLAVARIASGTPELALLERSLRSIGDHDPLVVGRSLAPGVHRLRAGGRLELAARVRLRCLDVMPAVAINTFEVIAAPGPQLVPWATFGVP